VTGSLIVSFTTATVASPAGTSSETGSVQTGAGSSGERVGNKGTVELPRDVSGSLTVSGTASVFASPSGTSSLVGSCPAGVSFSSSSNIHGEGGRRMCGDEEGGSQIDSRREFGGELLVKNRYT
jgi:hypothetical protein